MWLTFLVETNLNISSRKLFANDFIIYLIEHDLNFLM